MRKLMFALVLCTAGAFARQLVVNGNFSDENGNPSLKGWRHSQDVTASKDKNGNNKLVVTGENHSASQTLKLKPEDGKIQLKMWMKVTDVVYGGDGWRTGRLAMTFQDENRKMVGPWPDVFGMVGTNDWTFCERTYIVPKGAAYLDFSASNFGKSGTVEFKDISFTVTAERITAPVDAACPPEAGDAMAIADAWHQQTPTREKVCLNGLWQFRPVLNSDSEDKVPAAGDSWGWFRIPAVWPTTRWTEDSTQKPILSPYLETELGKDEALSTQAWFQRRFTVPANWQNRDIAIDFTLVNTFAKVFVDGAPAGDVWFPGGEVNLSQWLKPGQEQTIALLVKAMPLDNERLDFMAPDRIIESKATLKFKGVTGDVFLLARPLAQRLDHVAIVTSVRNHTIGFQADLKQSDDRDLVLSADVFDADNQLLKSFRSAPLRASNTNTIAFTAPWRDAPRWDIDSPTLLSAKVTLATADGQVVDQFTPVTFGFREFWIKGRDLMLNDSVIRLRALHNTSSNSSASPASKEGVINTIDRMRRYGFNFLITGNYNFRPGDMSYIDGLLDGCQENGMLMSFSLPHVSHFSWKLHEPDVRKRYTDMTRWLIRRVQNNPAVVMYAMNHNATGYHGDQNPLKLDGVYQPEPKDLDWSKLVPDKGFERWNRRVQAKHAENIAKSFDSSRPIYHHESGNLGDVFCINIYLNWSPLQERSDWMETWSRTGTKPVFFVEWGLPHISTWSSYRGPAFIWRTPAFQSLWAAEFAAAELGNDAYAQAMAGSAAIDREEKLWATGEPFPWSSLCHAVNNYPFYVPIMAKYARDNWRSHRTHGVSAMLPWDQETLWRRKPGTSTNVLNPNAYQGLKAPGIVPERITGSGYLYDRGDVNDFTPSELGKEFLRWNQPLCAYIGGKADEPTDKTSVYAPREKVAKSIVIINDSRAVRVCDYQWSFDGQSTKNSVKLAVGEIKIIPITLRLPRVDAPSTFDLALTCSFDNGVTFTDSISLRAQPALPRLKLSATPQLFDPAGKTRDWLKRIGLREVDMLNAYSTPDLSRMIIVGREALSNTPALPWLGDAVRTGRVLVFEQTQEVLSERLGFRTNIHGLRELFVRTPDHPAIRALGRNPDALFKYWRGHATMTTPFLEDLPHFETSDPRWNWHDFRNTRVWRAGNRNAVASVLIEKPSAGNWTALIDGGFDLQYAPLLECELEHGRTIFCQLDVTARSEDDFSATQLTQALINYLDKAPAPKPARKAFYAGNDQGRDLLQQLGVTFAPYADQALDSSSLLILGPGAFQSAPALAGRVATATNNGCNTLALGLNAAELASIDPELVAEDGVQDYAQPLPAVLAPALRGVSAAETYWHTKLTFTALRLDGFEYATHAVLAMPHGNGQGAIQQAPPWLFDYVAKPYLRTSYRRSLYLTARLLANLGAAMHNPLPNLIARAPSPRKIDLSDGWTGIDDPKNTGRDQGWFKSDFDSAAWPPIEVPGTFDTLRPELANYDGHFWYRKRFQTPANLNLTAAELYIGPVDDESWVWLNDTFLGEVTKTTNPDNYWSFPRLYQLKPGMLKTDGENVLTILVNDTYLRGGIINKPALQIRGPWLDSYYLQTPQASDDPYRYYRW